MSSYFIKEFVLMKNDSKYRQNVLMDMVEFESRYKKYIRDIKSENEDSSIIIIYYVDYE